MRKKNGFTLIELLAVIVILAIIALIAAPLTINVINSSKEKSVNESEVKCTETSEEECKIVIQKTFTEVMEEKIATGEVARDTTEDQNLRYVGPSPNNYVYFNKDPEGNPEKWRIIGVFHDETKGDQIKIIRDEYYSTGIEWDECDGDYSNNWVTASLNVLWNDKESATSYIKTIETNDPTSYGYIDVEHIWNIGGTPNYMYSTRSEFYTAERSDTPAGSEGSEATWTGTIGLMYTSDYGYATSGTTEICDSTVMYKWDDVANKTAFRECVKNSWLYDENNNQYTFTPRSDVSDTVFSVYRGGYVFYRVVNAADNKVRPVLFLKSDTKIVGGQGTYDEPYELGL